MAQQTKADDGSTDAQIDPELAANTVEQAAESLQVYLGRDAMREFGREHGSRSSGTKQEMADSMLAEAREQALALLVEEGVELGGDLTEDDEGAAEDEQPEQEAEGDLAAPEDVPAETMDEVAREYGMGAGAVKGSLAFMDEGEAVEADSEADEAALEARRRAAQATEDEDEQEDSEDSEDDSSQGGQQPTLAGELLQRDPADHRLGDLTMSEKQTTAVLAALEDPERTKEELAEAADCTSRYAATTLERWAGSEDQVEAVEAEGSEVPSEYTEVGA